MAWEKEKASHHYKTLNRSRGLFILLLWFCSWFQIGLAHKREIPPKNKNRWRYDWNVKKTILSVRINACWPYVNFRYVWFFYLTSFILAKNFLESLGVFWGGCTSYTSRIAAQCLHWKYVLSRFATSQNPCVEQHCGQLFSVFRKFSISSRPNCDPNTCNSIVSFMCYEAVFS